MHGALITFLCLLGIFFIGVAYLLRGTWSVLATQAQVHAATYAISYLKGMALVAIAGGACFTETFRNVLPSEAATWAWWDWAVAFWKPIAAGLACFVAFVDRSMDRAKEEAAKGRTGNTNPGLPMEPKP